MRNNELTEKTSVRTRLFSCLSVIISICLILILAFNLYFPLARRISGQDYPSLFGWRQAVVLTSSMLPTLAAGDLILIHEAASYEPGDILTYQTEGSLITHRLQAVDPAGFVLQGDANLSADRPVQPQQILGRMVLRIPAIGQPGKWLRSLLKTLDR